MTKLRFRKQSSHIVTYDEVIYEGGREDSIWADKHVAESPRSLCKQIFNVFIVKRREIKLLSISGDRKQASNHLRERH